ncbi:hypothetical protein [Cytobacillus horneckiae]|uniref:hypothetical protein n=1 Tax=Cytobacillus horneckiae TaxID=549687 RepID=UPI003D9A7BC5
MKEEEKVQKFEAVFNWSLDILVVLLISIGSFAAKAMERYTAAITSTFGSFRQAKALESR